MASVGRPPKGKNSDIPGTVSNPKMTGAHDNIPNTVNNSKEEGQMQIPNTVSGPKET
jgi:hypothetical protein